LATDRLDTGAAQALVRLVGRRDLLKAAAGGVATLMLAACQASPTPATPAPTGAQGAPSTPTTVPPTTAAAAALATAPAPPTAAAAAAAAGQAPWVYVFNVGSQDVTIIETATNNLVATRPLGAAVRWLSNQQRYWDGQHIWTYDFPDNKLVALAIDPKQVQVVKKVDTGTTGPGHSVMLTPDRSTALLNAAGSNVINVIDVKAGQVTDKIDTGKFP
jgi:YVTN family beta-propeller protein